MSDLDLPLAVRMMQDGYLMEIQDLKAENAKLRELVRDVWAAFHGATSNEFAEVKNRVRELGVEVDA